MPPCGALTLGSIPTETVYPIHIWFGRRNQISKEKKRQGKHIHCLFRKPAQRQGSTSPFYCTNPTFGQCALGAILAETVIGTWKVSLRVVMRDSELWEYKIPQNILVIPSNLMGFTLSKSFNVQAEPMYKNEHCVRASCILLIIHPSEGKYIQSQALQTLSWWKKVQQLSNFDKNHDMLLNLSHSYQYLAELDCCI